ncbi:MAG: ATP-binding cassette domain-containing protein, partial [Candidatus Binatota bacterium]
MNRSDGQEAALRAEGLWFAYREPDWVLKDVCLSAPQGKITIIMGPSGTGKTTLLKILTGILTPARGRVEVLDHAITNQSQRTVSSLIGYIPQQLGL